MNPEQAQDFLDAIQVAAFRMASTWARGIDLSYAGVDMVAPMLYQLTAIFNQQMIQHYFPPAAPAVQNTAHPEQTTEAAQDVVEAVAVEAQQELVALPVEPTETPIEAAEAVQP